MSRKGASQKMRVLNCTLAGGQWLVYRVCGMRALEVPHNLKDGLTSERTHDVPIDHGGAADAPRMDELDGMDSAFTSTVPPNPAADKIAHRMALMPRNCPGPVGVSALHVRISPKAPGPSSRPSG